MIKKIYFGVGLGVIFIYVVSSLVGFEATPPNAAQSLGIMRMTRSKPAPPRSTGGTYPGGYPGGSGPRGGK